MTELVPPRTIIQQRAARLQGLLALVAAAGLVRRGHEDPPQPAHELDRDGLAPPPLQRRGDEHEVAQQRVGAAWQKTIELLNNVDVSVAHK